jgi:adenine-specific DNA-methyltransferase
MARPKKTTAPSQAQSYRHTTAESPLRPDVGTQAQLKKRKAPQTYRYDSSLSPALDWDGQNSAREQGEAAGADATAEQGTFTERMLEVLRKVRCCTWRPTRASCSRTSAGRPSR